MPGKWSKTGGRRLADFHPPRRMALRDGWSGEVRAGMDLFIAIAGYGLVAAAVGFVLSQHWQEFHGDHHF